MAHFGALKWLTYFTTHYTNIHSHTLYNYTATVERNTKENANLNPISQGCQFIVLFVNPQRACAAMVTVLALCVCLSVTTLAATAFVSACNKRHQQHSLRLFLDLTHGFPKNPSVRKLWREKPNMQIGWSSPRAVFAQFRDQRNAQGNWSVARGDTSETQARAYSTRPGQ